MKQTNGSSLDRVFHISLVLKALDSLLEIIGGLLALSISPTKLNHLVRNLTQHELPHDPHDFIATHLLKASQNFSHSGRTYAGVYLLSHGVVKIVVIVALLRGKLWAYPVLMAVLAMFVIYQTYRLFDKFSFGLVVLTLFDLLIIGLTWKEYRKRLDAVHSQA